MFGTRSEFFGPRPGRLVRRHHASPGRRPRRPTEDRSGSFFRSSPWHRSRRPAAGPMVRHGPPIYTGRALTPIVFVFLVLRSVHRPNVRAEPRRSGSAGADGSSAVLACVTHNPSWSLKLTRGKPSPRCALIRGPIELRLDELPLWFRTKAVQLLSQPLWIRNIESQPSCHIGVRSEVIQ